MIFTCEKQQLQDALALVVRVVSSRTTLSILECVLLTATEDEGITLCASDLEVSIETKPISAEVERGGSVALDAKLFTDIVRKLSGDFVTIEVDENFTALCKSGRSRLKISGQPPDEFPTIEMEQINEGVVNTRYALKTSVLRDMIRQTIFSVSLDQSKIVLTGELLEIKENSLRIVAVDMFRISYRAEKLEGASDDVSAVVPGKAMNELSRILPSEDSEVSFYFTPKWAVFEADTFMMVSRILEGDFVRYEQIFNEDFSTAVIVNRVQLLSAFERAVLVAVDNRMPPTQLEIHDNDLLITAHNERGQVNDGIPCETDGKELTIHFNPRYFIEALRAIEDERVELKFNTQLSPCTIRGAEEGSDFKYLIVPLRPE